MNSSDKTSAQVTTPTDSSKPSSDAQSDSVETTEVMEAPLLTLNPTQKPLIEMTDEELAQWHSNLTRHLQNPQTLAAHARTPRAEKVKVPKEPPPDKYV